ncbi:MAG: ABC transporter permease [Saprospiraceae bacterium]
MNESGQIHPPEWPLHLLRCLIKREFLEEIEGDMEEVFQDDLERFSLRKARWRYTWGTLKLLRSGLIRFPLINTPVMLQSNFKLFLRHLKRYPVHSALNLACLTVGLAAALFIALYLDFEINYDRFHTRYENIYRIQTPAIQTREKVMEVNWPTTPAGLAPLIVQDLPEVNTCVRFFNFFTNAPRLEYGSRSITEMPEQVVATDPEVFDVFSFDLIRGRKGEALTGPNKIVISEDLAARLFGSEDPMGKTISTRLVHGMTNEEQDYALEVSGIFRDLPRNTHLYFQALISAETDPELQHYSFGRFNTYTYVLLHEKSQPAELGAKLTALYDRYLSPEVDPVLLNARHELEPLARIHLLETNGSSYLYILGGVGILLLLISFISYVNLVTAQSGRRALEIGLRKVLGSQRSQLITQFLTESMASTLMAAVVAFALVFLLTPSLNSMMDLHIDTSRLLNTRFLFLMVSSVVLLALAGGSYPAFFLSAFRPVVAMKGQWKRSAPIRRYLLGFQFAVVVFVLIGTGMIYRQLRYLREKDLGFDQDYVLRLELPGGEVSDQLEILKNGLLSTPDILSVAFCDFTPGLGGMVNGPVSAEGSEAKFVRRGRVDYDYLETMGIDLIYGRNFSRDLPTDAEDHVLVNETFVRQFELGDQALGAKVRFGGSGNPKYYQIIGIVADFNQSSLHNAIEPQLFRLSSSSSNMIIRVAEDPTIALGHLEANWKKNFPDQPFHYTFLNDLLADQYREDQRRGSLFLFFSGITIFIAFVSLYGLASYLIRQRNKEVGIRKVFGASTGNILFLLTRDFLWLVALAALPGLLAAWYVANRWLENFAFRASVNYLLITLILLSVFLLTFLTVGGHAVRAARMNPKETLRWE